MGSGMRRRSLVGNDSRPRVACPTCGLRIPLDTIVVAGQQRTLRCVRCHAVETWALDLRD
jgi:formate dehydrogenase maturation protein FdhE